MSEQAQQEIYLYKCSSCEWEKNSRKNPDVYRVLDCPHCRGVWMVLKPRTDDMMEQMPMSQEEIERPAHYITPSGLESVHVIEAFGLEANFYRATTVAYLLRAGRKGGKAEELEDLKKARQWLGREIKRLEGKEGEW